MTNKTLKIFNVDDDPVAHMIVDSLFDNDSFQTISFGSGEACLAALDQEPDIILMDVEMPGMDGIAACRSLREAGNTNAYVLFVSSHDDLETRLHAYDAGGNDYLVKPFAPAELRQKIQVASQLLAQRSGLAEQSQIARQTAFTAMSSMGEIGLVLHFLRTSFSCQSYEQLGRELFATLEQYGLKGLIEMRTFPDSYAASSRGECLPLELSILAHARGMGRIFQFSDRMAINYPRVTLLVFELPMDDPDRVGRLRDHLAHLAEGVESRVAAMAQSSQIATAAKELGSSLTRIESRQTGLRIQCLELMNDYVLYLERSFVQLGLSESQERILSDQARNARDRIGDLLGESKDAADGLQRVVVQLQQMLSTA